jgi:hypothetical protein
MKITQEELKEKIMKSLDEVKLSQSGWEGNEDIVIFNGKPIGMTISNRNLELGRWWPELKEHLAIHLAKSLLKDCSTK